MVMQGTRTTSNALSEGTNRGTSRLPPGQVATTKFPVLHQGSIPPFDPSSWNFRLFGLVDHPVQLTYQQFMQLPHTQVTVDVHCVTGWSRLGDTYEGVLFMEVLKLGQLDEQARYVMVHAENGMCANLPLEAVMAENAIFAHRLNGLDLSPSHGWPLRLVVPSRYFYKSPKWVRGAEVLAEDRPGYWEQLGYHMNGDPWREERGIALKRVAAPMNSG